MCPGRRQKHTSCGTTDRSIASTAQAGSGQAADQGVSVEVGRCEVAVDLNVVPWYGQSIVEISEAVRRNVVGQVEGMCGLKVIEVNIQVDDVHVETPQDSQPEPSRVQ